MLVSNVFVSNVFVGNVLVSNALVRNAFMRNMLVSDVLMRCGVNRKHNQVVGIEHFSFLVEQLDCSGRHNGDCPQKIEIPHPFSVKIEFDFSSGWAGTAASSRRG